MTRATVLGLVLLVFTGAASASPTVEREIPVDGRVRRYLIHAPPPRVPARAMPVVFVFHGAGSDSESMVAATGFDALADREGFLVVYPRATLPGRRYEVESSQGRTSPDVRFVQALLARLRARFPVDDRRIFATGFSNGAAFCYRLAADLPGTFAAIAPVAGYLPQTLGTAPAALPSLLAVHGTGDGRVSVSSATTAVARWAGWAGCTGTPTDSWLPDAAPWRARRSDYACPSGGARVGLLLFVGVGHEWPGGPGGVLTREVWRLFRSPRGATLAPR